MELKRILAKDSRTAMDIAMNRYGKDVLIVSSQSVGGQIELVVALDAAPAPAPAPVPSTGAPSAFTQAFRQALGPMPEAPQAPQTPSHAQAQAQAQIDRDPLVMPAALAFRKNAAPAAAVAAAAPAPLAAPVAHAAPMAETVPQPLAQPQAQPQPVARPLAAADEAGRLAIDLVRREIAALRKEFAMSRQVQAWQDGRHWPPALSPVIHALQEQGVPAGLRALMIDAAAEAQDSADAVDAMRQLVGDALSAPPAVRLERGVHAILGPSGAGKSHMVTRLARAAALRAGSQQVAIIAFNDQRFGAWSHTRVLAAQAGVACLRAADAGTLRLLLDELSGHALVFVDTAGSDCLAQAKALRELNLGIHLHLLMPADASIGGVRSLLENNTPWRSLMVGKVDESVSPWPLLQALSEGRPPVSYMCDTGSVQSAPRAFDARALVGPAFDRLAAEVRRIQREASAGAGRAADSAADYAADSAAANPGAREFNDIRGVRPARSLEGTL